MRTDASIPNERLTARDRVILAALSLALLVPGTIGVSLFDRDEGWYAQVSREMLERGDWLVPRYLGQAWLAKPPLLYWCVAGSFAAFGRSEASARLVPVLATAGGVQLLASLAASLGGRRVAWVASVTFLTAGLTLVAGKMVLTDALLLLCVVGAALALWRIATQGVMASRCVGFWAWCGLGVLAKGPAIALFVGALAFALLREPATRRWMTSGRFWLASLVGLVIAVPWYAYVGVHAGGALWRQFLGFEIASRIAGAPHGHTGPPGYHLLVALAGWLPWTALVPGAIVLAWRQRRSRPVDRTLLLWCAIPWLVLEIIRSKLPHYAWPCYVPIAILIGRSLQTARLSATWRWTLGATIAFHGIVGLVLLPRLEPYRLSRQIADTVNERTGASIAILVNGYDEPTMFFYLDRPARLVHDDELAAAFRSPASPVILVARDRDWRRVGIDPGAAGADWTTLAGYNYVKGRRETVWVCWKRER